jgi:hypothetical protein
MLADHRIALIVSDATNLVRNFSQARSAGPTWFGVSVVEFVPQEGSSFGQAHGLADWLRFL